MPWDTQETRRRLKDAATVEFAERGPDGTTMARIAERAGINKERLYKYFGDKRALFESVLSDELDKLAASVPPMAPAFDDIGEYAGHTFDYHMAHPELVRLLLWEGLAGGHAAEEIKRSAHYQDKVEAVAAAQRAGHVDAGLDPAHLVFLLTALAAWWGSVPQLARMLTDTDPDDEQERARRRASVVEAARRLAAPR
jgi:AcrR family transcriptional regulator